MRLGRGRRLRRRCFRTTFGSRGLGGFGSGRLGVPAWVAWLLVGYDGGPSNPLGIVRGEGIVGGDGNADPVRYPVPVDGGFGEPAFDVGFGEEEPT